MTTQQTKVDWDRPIEAVHADGRVVTVTLVETDINEPYTPRKVSPRLTKPDAWWFQEDGLWDSSRPHDWRIRNVAQPEAPTPSPELTARMVAFVRMGQKLPGMTFPEGHPIGAFFAEMDAIATELEPVDGDLEDGDNPAYLRGYYSGRKDAAQAIADFAQGIADRSDERGRALAEAGK